MTASAANTAASTVNLIQFKERGQGKVNAMHEMLLAAGSTVSYLDASIISVNDLYLPIWDSETKTVRNHIADHLLKGDVLILDEVEGASDEVLEAIGTLMDNRTLANIEVPSIKVVVVFVNGREERTKNIVEALRILGQTTVLED